LIEVHAELVAVRKRRAAPRCLGVGPGGTKRLRRIARAIFKSGGKAARCGTRRRRREPGLKRWFA